MRQVSKGEFYAAVGKLNVHPKIVSGFPYECQWIFLNDPRGPLFGKTVDRVEGGLTVTDYFLNDTHQSGGAE
ncbi:hypothetical protein ACFO1V_02965 [Daeguia caeni]|uniref:Uncharacterized protein n=1 Tax=Daeguia caeni TaxID=439612 RepID=A0ABV9H3X5_9HYPH